MKKQGKKILSVLLALILTVSLFPMQSFAAEPQEFNQQGVNMPEEGAWKEGVSGENGTLKQPQEALAKQQEQGLEEPQEQGLEQSQIQTTDQSPISEYKQQDEIPDQSSVSEPKQQDEIPDQSPVPEPEEQDMTPEQLQNVTAEQLNINYVVVDTPNVQIPGTQKILLGIGNESSIISNPVLNVVREEDGTVLSIPLSQRDGDAYLFTKEYTQDSESGTYKIVGVTYIENGVEITQNLSDYGYEDVRYGVNTEVTVNPDGIVVEGNEETEGIDIVTIDEDGNAVSADSISDAIANAADSSMAKTGRAGGNVVVVLDPGHDNTHAGTQASGLKEEQLNLKIAQYCREELQKYNGVTVYMTRPDDGSCPYPGTSSGDCNANRVAFAQSVGADVYVSLHLNSADASAKGAEIYYPNGNYNQWVGEQGKQLASIIEDKLVALGLQDRGIKIVNSKTGDKYDDGSEADYYGVIRRSKLVGIPAIIVEHAFQSNAEDVNNFLSSEEGLKKLGVADATGIAQYFGLSKSDLDLNGICYIYRDNAIDIGVDYSTRGSNIRFKWQSYNLDTQQWEVISDWFGGNWASWKPEKGNYWLQVQAVTDEGYSQTLTICFQVVKNYSPTAVGITGICYQYQDNAVNIGVGYESNDPNLQFKWLSYNLDTQKWEQISDWFGGNWASWKPKAGNYWLQAQVMNSLGQVQSYTTCFYSEKNYITDPLTLEGIVYVAGKDNISVGAAYTAEQPGTKFQWLAYNVNTNTWQTVSKWSGSNWANWNPQPGNYWLRVEAKTTNGIVKDYTYGFTIDKDFSKKSLEITGICVLEEPIGINVGAAYDTAASEVNFKFSIYDVDKNQWMALSDWMGGNWVTWYPESGNYWIYVEAVTNEGVTANKCIGYSLDSRYGIMGVSNTTVEQMVRYYTANQQYPAFYSTSDAADIVAFCTIYMEECMAEGVRAEVAFSQAMKETGFLRYKGDVRIEQFNFAGLGATGGGNPGNTFNSVREGIRAQIQHLKAYASTQPLNNPCVDDRFNLVKRGTAPYVEWLGIQENPYGKGWATAKNYGYSIKNDYMKRLFTF